MRNKATKIEIICDKSKLFEDISTAYNIPVHTMMKISTIM